MSHLSEELIGLFALGHLSGAQVHDLASSAWADGWGRGSTLARKLANPNVESANNMARDVLRAAKEAGIGSTMAQPYFVELTAGKGSIGVLLPHEVYAEMARNEGSLTKFTVGADRGGLMGNLVEQWCAHPDVAIEGEARASVALMGIHADAVTWSTNIRAGIDRKVIICSWNVITGSHQAAAAVFRLDEFSAVRLRMQWILHRSTDLRRAQLELSVSSRWHHTDESAQWIAIHRA